MHSLKQKQRPQELCEIVDHFWCMLIPITPFSNVSNVEQLKQFQPILCYWNACSGFYIDMIKGWLVLCCKIIIQIYVCAIKIRFTCNMSMFDSSIWIYFSFLYKKKCCPYSHLCFSSLCKIQIKMCRDYDNLIVFFLVR